jgi:membrane protease YdiL (CAAX protease family)
MKPIRAWLAYLALVLSVGAAVAPLLWHGVQWLAPHSSIASQPFHRYVHRSLLVLAIVGLWPLAKVLGARFPQGLGIRLGMRPMENALLGWTVGLGSLGTVALISVMVGARQLHFSASATEWGKKLVGALATALVVGVLEEGLFRGALFTSLRRRHSWGVSASCSSGLYALVHFFQRTPEPATVSWQSGWVILGQMMAGFWDWATLMPGFFSLFLVGWILAVARDRTDGLAASIGLHGAWIFWIKACGFALVASPTATTSVWGSSKWVDGWATFAILGVTLVFVQAKWPKPRGLNLRK